MSSRIYRKELMKIIGFWKRAQDETELTIGTLAISTSTRQHRKATVNPEE
jgi:hypothetical protein